MSYRGRRQKKYTLQILWIIAALTASAGLLIGYKLGFSEDNKNDESIVSAAGENVTVNIEHTPIPTEVLPTITPTIEPTPSLTPIPTVQGPFQVYDPNEGQNKEDTMSGNETEVAGEDDNVEEKEEQKMVALTFDDGPFPKVTNRILDLLEEYNAKATFFLMGDRVERFKETIQREYDEGHQVASHTYSHKDLTKLSKDKIKYEVEHTNDLLNEVIDVGDVYIRPPYGANNNLVRETVQVPMILWSVDSEDWKSKDKDIIYKEIMDHVQDGDIILMHDLYPTTADAMELVIPELIRQGYQLVTVEELFEAKKILPEGGKIYHNGRK